jgi:hypothetical protein
MITITVPEFDQVLLKDEIHLIPENKSGIYFLYDLEGELIYIGQAADLKSRLFAHFNLLTHTKPFAHLFVRCSMFQEGDQINKNIYELYLINKYKPFLNVRDKVSDRYSEAKKITRFSPKCQYIHEDGRPCKRVAHVNGFCGSHGGNGITKKTYVEKAIREFEEQLTR